MSFPDQSITKQAHFTEYCVSNVNTATAIAGGANMAACALIIILGCVASRQVRRGDIKLLNNVLLPLYQAVMNLICIVLLGRFAIWVFVSKASEVFDFLNWIVLCPTFAALRDGVAVFVALDSAGFYAMKLAALFMVAWTLGLGTLGFFAFLNATVADDIFNSFFWRYYNGSAVVLHLVILARQAIRRCMYKGSSVRRPGPTAYSLFVLVMVVIFLVVNLKVFPSQTTGCLWEVSVIAYNLLWPLASYLVFRSDSAFWRRAGVQTRAGLRKLGMPLLDSEAFDNAVIIDFTAIDLKDVVAVGGTATVYKARYKNKAVAVKRCICDNISPERAYSYMREIGMLSQLQHPNIVRLYGVIVTPPFVSLVMELSERGSLFDVLTIERRLRRLAKHRQAQGRSCDDIRARYISPIQRLFLMKDAWAGLAFLHAQSPPVLHGDIKSLNMLLDKHFILKLCDFGESRFDHDAQQEDVPAHLVPLRAAHSEATLASNARSTKSLMRVGSLRGEGLERSTSAQTISNAWKGRPGSVHLEQGVGAGAGSGVMDTTTVVDTVGNGSTEVTQLAFGDESEYRYKQTPQWAAPEVFTHSKSTTAADVFSCASVMYEICACQPPFYRVSARRVARMVVSGKRPKIPKRTPTALKDIMVRCWRSDPNARPTAKEVLDILTELTPTRLEAESSIQMRMHEEPAPPDAQGVDVAADVDAVLHMED